MKKRMKQLLKRVLHEFTYNLLIFNQQYIKHSNFSSK